MLPHDIRQTQTKIERRLQLIKPLIYRKSVPLPPFRFNTLADALTPPPLDADIATWETIPPASYWGAKGMHFALATPFTIPDTFDPAAPAALLFNIGESGDFDHPEALIYIDGEAFCGVDRRHQEIHLPDRWRDGREHRLLLHGWCGLMGGTHVTDARKLYMGTSALVQVDVPTREFYTRAHMAWVAAKNLPENDPAKSRLFNALDDAFKVLDTRDPLGDCFYDSLPAADHVLREGIKAAGMPLDVSIAATGHAHIDVAWLWTVDETRHKAARTFSTVLRLMEQYPEFRFVQSTPQLYQWIMDDQPALFEQIKARIQEGRWETIGGMWLEADCNLTGAESLVRQLMYGRAFYRKHFGKDAESPVLWLPDVFGYAWNLPQLIKGAGLEYFFTIKIGWNQYNRLPYDSFWWQGLDGTKVLTHFSTAPEAHDINSRATYNAEVDSMVALGTWINYQQKHLHSDILMSYGWGDGGGGPTREMIENVRTLDAMPGIPQVRQARVIDFFRDLETESGAKLPTWNGELYLEAHRGTYTTQARNKRWNRKSEFLLHDAEFLATVASLLDKTYQYPHAALHQAWEILLLHQFHDIIPGSSIHEVYEQSERYYEEITRIGEKVKQDALEVIQGHYGGEPLMINPSGSQTYVEEPDRICPPYTVWVNPESLPSTGESWIEASPRCLDNGTLRIELNENGDISRVYLHKAGRLDFIEMGREILPSGAIANQFQLFEDRPNNWDAWDIDIFFDDRVSYAEPAHRIELVENTAYRKTIKIERRIGNSDYVQRISMTRDARHFDVRTGIIWRERHSLLKVAFPVDMLATKAIHEVQWGNVERPTTRNTSWDWARFETCAHKWVMLQEGDFAVSLINDCKYGHDVRDNVIRLSLLRSPTNPDPDADQRAQHFAYRFTADTTLQNTVRSAYTFNDPGFTVEGVSTQGKAASFHLIDLIEPEIVQVETVKRAEDDNGVIIRLYEYTRNRSTIKLRLGFPVREAYITNLLEENQSQLEVTEGGTITFPVTPFQIVTLRVIPE